ncbi:MAG: PQQ-binding-like beta-propeller repeat protein [Acidobacteriota bacterium]|nr:PQQ-binding-like beta-propeller repeat protein [Acidobacteriota bacterium]
MAKGMGNRVRVPAVAFVILALHGSHATAQDGESSGNWAQFRGARASGVADGFGAPMQWNAETGENILWKAPIPGLGHSSPVVWGELVCVTTADSGAQDTLKVGLYGDIESVPDEVAHRWEIRCLDKTTGTRRWAAVVHRGIPVIPRHPKSTHANSTLATDGTHLVALFGSEGLYGYDLMTGRELWKVDLGVLDSGYFNAPTALWGFAGSPVIHEGIVVVQADVLNGSFLATFSVETGEELWRIARDDVPTWSTPTVHVVDGQAQIVVNGYRHIGGYTLSTGHEVWRMTGGGDIPTPTPILDNGVIFVTNAHGGEAPIFAINAGASGDITPAEGVLSTDHLVWSQRRDGAYMQTPIVYRGLLYNCRDNGVLSVYDPRTGRRLYQRRIGRGGSGFSASPVAADGKVYFSSEDGSVFALRAGPEFEILAENPMGETLMATPAISEGVMYFRTRGNLVAVGANPG